MVSRRASPPRPARRAIPSLLTGILALLAGRAEAQGDPFAPGARWTLGPAIGAPAQPRSVAFAAQENAAVAAWTGANPGFSASAVHDLGPVQPLARGAAPAGAQGSLSIAAGAGPWIVHLYQVPAPDAWNRRTRVEGAHVGDVAASGTIAARWVHEFAFTANGPARLAAARDGATAWVAAYDDAAQRVEAVRLDCDTGAVLATAAFPALALQEIATSADGTRVALAAGLDVRVLDAAGAEIHHQALPATTSALALAGDGRTLVHGIPGGLAVRVDAGAGFEPRPALNANPGEIAACIALDARGTTLAIGWWHAATGVAWRFQVRDLAAGSVLVTRAFQGTVGGLQDLPTAVALTPEGTRGAFACWSGSTGAPEAALWDRASGTFMLETDLAGSAFALALDASGTRALVAAKSAHANVLSGTGEVVMLDSGARDLQILGAPRVGGTLHLAARSPGASAVLFLFGDPAPAPFRVPGIAGSLGLLRVGLGVRREVSDPAGRADWTSRVPADPALLGTVRHVQAAFRGPSGTWFGTTLVSVWIL